MRTEVHWGRAVSRKCTACEGFAPAGRLSASGYPAEAQKQTKRGPGGELPGRKNKMPITSLPFPSTRPVWCSGVGHACSPVGPGGVDANCGV